MKATDMIVSDGNLPQYNCMGMNAAHISVNKAPYTSERRATIAALNMMITSDIVMAESLDAVSVLPNNARKRNTHNDENPVWVGLNSRLSSVRGPAEDMGIQSVFCIP